MLTYVTIGAYRDSMKKAGRNIKRCLACRSKVVETDERNPKYWNGAGRPRLFCSDRCRQRFHRRQIKLPMKLPVTIGGNPKNLRKSELLAELSKVKEKKQSPEREPILH